MNLTRNPVQLLSDVLALAVYKDTSDLTYKKKDWYKSKEQGEDVFRDVTRKVRIDEIEICTMFPQGFSNTACGHGGVAGQAMTTAYVICLLSVNTNEGLVYSAGRLLRKFDMMDHDQNSKFYKIVTDRRIKE